MTTSKGKDIITASQTSHECCCMCGDSGLSHELFRCKLCQFRSQHRYCSNLYPDAESNQVCNWCLNQKEDIKEKSPNSSHSSTSNKNSSYDSKNVKKKINYNDGGLIIKSQLKKEITSDQERSASTRKRIISNGRLQEKLIRRTKSEEISNNGIVKHVFRNKVRRYKLLDEVSS